jgi:hypothetical protein
MSGKGIDKLSMGVWDEISDQWMKYSRG